MTAFTTMTPHAAATRRFLVVLSALAALASVACGTTGATFRSGVADATLEHPPYYAGVPASVLALDTTRTGHLPIAYQVGASQPSIVDPQHGPGTATGDLLAEMNLFLDSLTRARGVSVRLVEGNRVSSVTHSATTVPPDVRFGCVTELDLPGNDCASPPGLGAPGRGRQEVRLAVGRPSREWTAWMRDVMRDRGVRRVLVITLEVGQLLPRQTGVTGAKQVELGTGNTVTLPWLTSVETPVSVLQLTGALMDGDGRAIRIGAEGFYALRTRLLVSAAGGQELLRDEHVREARAMRRDDIPGAPFAWRVALTQLVAGLAGRGEIAAAAR